MKLIPLTQGQFAKVDDEDYDVLSQYNWQAAWSKGVMSFYAMRTDCVGGRKTVHS